MGKRLSQLNEVEQVSSTDYLLVDGEEYLESKKILIKNINIKNFNTEDLDRDLEGKQDVLIDGKNIKKINGQSILGEGEIKIQGGESTSSLVQAPEYSPSSIIISKAKDNVAGSAGFEWIKVSKNKNGNGYDYVCAENSKSELNKLKEAWVQAKGFDNKNYYLSFYAVNPNSGEQKETSHRSDGSLYIIDIDPDNCIIKGSGYYDGWTPEDGSNNGWTPIYEGNYSKLGQGSTIRAIDFPTIGTIETVEYAVSMGHNNKIIGDASVGLGKNNIVNGSYAFAAGRDNYVGYNGTSFGRRNKVKGQMGAALGQENEILGHNDTAIGTGLKDNGSSTNQLMAGRYNVPDAEALLIVGNGNSNDDRRNAFVVKKTGEIITRGSDLYVWDRTIATEFAGGNGTEEAPYIIKTPEQFALMVENFGFGGSYFSIVNDLYFNDIMLDKNNWTNTEWYGQKKNNSGSNYYYENTLDVQGTFIGNIDGNGHSIYGIYHTSKTDEDKYYYTVGLIPSMGNGYIKNLAIKNSYFYGVGAIGGFIGKCARTAYSSDGIINIENCYVNHDVTLYCNAKGNAGVGGIIGYAVTQEVNIINCYSLTSNISSWDGLKGGLVGNGWNSPYYLTQCYSVYQPYPLDNLSRKPKESTNVYSNAKNISNDNTITGLWTTVSNENMQGLDVLINPNKMSDLGAAFQATSYYPQLKAFFNNFKTPTQSNGDVVNKKYLETYLETKLEEKFSEFVNVAEVGQ